MRLVSFFLLIVFFCFLSCRPTRNISFEVMIPASVELPEPDTSFLILNCSYLPEYVEDPSNLLTLISLPEIIKVDSMITHDIFDGLFSILNESPYAGLRNAEYLEMRTADTTGFLTSLSPQTVAGLCEDHNVKYLVSFEYYRFNQTYDYYIDTENTYYGFLLHRQSLLWRIYSYPGQIIDECLLQDTLYSDELEVDYYDPTNGLFLNYSLTRDAFRETGIKYGERISPSWKNAYRFIYEIKLRTDSGTIRIKDDKDKLKHLSSSKNKTKAYMACFNLAVLAESQDDINNALKWLELATNHKHTILALKYKAILQNRRKELDLLDKQTNNTREAIPLPN